MITCQNCRYWKKMTNDQDTKTGMGCELPDLMILNTRHDSDSFRIEASALDDTNLDAVLITGPDFACIHGKQKNRLLNPTKKGRGGFPT